jgi:hypothetical protein
MAGEVPVMSKPAHNVEYGLDDESLDHTRAVFQPYSREPLTREDCRDIHRNLVGAFQVLLRIKRRLLAEERARQDATEADPQPTQPEVSHA